MILFGPPRAAEDIHAPTIVDKPGIHQLSTGDMLRKAVAAGSEVGKKAKAVMDSGGLVSDDIVIGIIKDRIQNPDCVKDFILDRFPRTFARSAAFGSPAKLTIRTSSSTCSFPRRGNRSNSTLTSNGKSSGTSLYPRATPTPPTTHHPRQVNKI